MQGTNKLTAEEEAEIRRFLPPGVDPEEAYCTVTNRIVIVSPVPGKLHELVRELAAACYDVMVFHHADYPLLLQLKPDLLILDFTRSEYPPGIEGIANLETYGTRLLQLVPPVSGASLRLVSAASLAWPSSLSTALSAIKIQMAQAPKAGRPALPLQEEGILHLKDLLLDLNRYIVQRGMRRVELTKTEFDLLRVILEGAGKVLSRQELLDQVWGEGYFGGSNIVDVHVRSLRQKLGDDPKKPSYVGTVRGIGYRAVEENM
ncbi:MAG: DNA-binding response regulator [Paenibacillaceae bacterium]|jgi:two-component system alkaline phosphatase synthesis response regulator PhoP|nr:DNA-binding response regulator [Paenibacillaceae bacterium]